MLIEEVAKLSPVQRFIYWIQERELIRKRKEMNLPKPWTDDKILMVYKFTCPRRMDDRVSKWLLENWYQPHFDHPNMVVACTIARHYNVPSALECITYNVFKKWSPTNIKSILRKRKAEGHNIFNGAYMVRGIGEIDKTEMVIERICKPLVENPPKIDKNSMEKSVEALLPYWGFSSFMAGQVVADLRWAMEGDWRDRNTWAPIGPGSLRGMNRVQGRPVKQPLKQDQFLKELLEIIEVCKEKLPSVVTDRLEAIDAQSALCEVDKYSRALLGEGKPKQRYPGAK